MTRPKRFSQAYQQAPWRIQTQQGVLLLILAVLGLSMLWVMVSVSVQASSAGLEIQAMEEEQDRLQREIAGLRTEIGVQTAKAQMEKRAADMGFEPINPAEVTYMKVPGYTGRQPVISASPPGKHIAPPLIKPVYTESLWEWLLEGILDINQSPGGLIK